MTLRGLEIILNEYIFKHRNHGIKGKIRVLEKNRLIENGNNESVKIFGQNCLRLNLLQYANMH